LALYKDQIKMLIEEEIVSRFHLEKGSIETGFKYDQEIKKAVEVLHNVPQYKKILNAQ
jgi:carboxyl-terminal processing protease